MKTVTVAELALVIAVKAAVEAIGKKHSLCKAFFHSKIQKNVKSTI